MPRLELTDEPMRSSKSRSRNKSSRQRTLGNIVNRVFDSSGPEGKVRGTPQQIIDKYLALARDAQLSNDRVAEQSFLQHAEHYTRLLGEALREQAERQQGQGGQPQGGQYQGGQQGWQPRGEDERREDDRREDRGRDERRDDRAREDRPQDERRDDRGRDDRRREDGRSRDEAVAAGEGEMPWRGWAGGSDEALPDAVETDEDEGPVDLPEARAAEDEPAAPAERPAPARDEAVEAEAAPAAPRKSSRTSSRSRSSGSRSKSEKPAPDAAAASE